MSKNKRLFDRFAALYIMGLNDDLKVEGPPEKVKCIVDALKTSRLLYEALESSDSDMQKILHLASEKNVSAKKYKNIVGDNWNF